MGKGVVKGGTGWGACTQGRCTTLDKRAGCLIRSLLLWCMGTASVRAGNTNNECSHTLPLLPPPCCVCPGAAGAGLEVLELPHPEKLQRQEGGELGHAGGRRMVENESCYENGLSACAYPSTGRGVGWELCRL